MKKNGRCSPYNSINCLTLQKISIPKSHKTQKIYKKCEPYYNASAAPA